MFTPQRRAWAGWSLTPARAGGAEGSIPTPPPPLRSLGDGRGDLGEGGEDMEAWERFRKEGLLVETGLLRKERDDLRTTVSKLQRELLEYQYNMGLLLIEKKDWTCKFDEIRERLNETEEILKREKISHWIAIAEGEKREENLWKALGVEKQCVADLVKALREMRAHASEASLEEKSLEVEQKLHSADAKHAEASRKSSEIERKLEEVEAREHKIQRVYVSLESDNERKAYEKDIAKQREHLLDWEKNLQEHQKRLVDELSSLNEREPRANETDRVLRKKEELAEVRKRIDFYLIL